MRSSDWSSYVCSSDLFERWVIAPNADIVQRLKALHPDTPIIGFPKGAGGKLAAYARETGVDALGLDETVDPVWADEALRSEEHTSELQSLMRISYAVFCLKKKTKAHKETTQHK